MDCQSFQDMTHESLLTCRRVPVCSPSMTVTWDPELLLVPHDCCVVASSTGDLPGVALMRLWDLLLSQMLLLHRSWTDAEGSLNSLTNPRVAAPLYSRHRYEHHRRH